MTESKTTLNLPPKFNRDGRYQFWFVEGVPQEQLVNGVLTGFVFNLAVFAVLTAIGVI